MKTNALFRFISKKDIVIFVLLAAEVVAVEIFFVPPEKAAVVATLVYTIFFIVAEFAFYGLLRAAIHRDLPGNKYFRSVPEAFSCLKRAWLKLETGAFIAVAIGVGGGLIMGMKPCAVLSTAALVFVFHALMRPITMLVKKSVALSLVMGLFGAFLSGFAAGSVIGDELSELFEEQIAAVCIVCAVGVISEAVSLIITYKKLPKVYND